MSLETNYTKYFLKSPLTKPEFEEPFDLNKLAKLNAVTPLEEVYKAQLEQAQNYSITTGTPDSVMGLTTTTMNKLGLVTSTSSSSYTPNFSAVSFTRGADSDGTPTESDDETDKGDKKKKSGLSEKGEQALGIGALVGAAAINMLDLATMGDKNFGAQSLAIDSVTHTASSALMASGNPYAMAAGAGLEALNFLTKASGQTTLGFDVNIENSGYGNLGHMESKSNRDFLGLGALTGRNERLLAERNELAQMALKAASISDEIKYELEARMNSVDNTIKLNLVALAGGLDTSILSAKSGGKLDRLISYEKKLKETKITKAQNGAKLTLIEVSDTPSVIPEGDLHKNLNHLDLDTTPKGIPVITVNDDRAETFEDIKSLEDTLELHAEIEAEEVIFNKSLTDFVEEARKRWHDSGKEDKEICKEVGMRVAKELLENTEDNTNLIARTEEKLKEE